MEELESLAGWMETVLDSTSQWPHFKSAQAPPGLSSRPRGAFAKATPTVRKENRPPNKSPDPVAQMKAITQYSCRITKVTISMFQVCLKSESEI